MIMCVFSQPAPGTVSRLLGGFRAGGPVTSRLHKKFQDQLQDGRQAGSQPPPQASSKAPAQAGSQPPAQDGGPTQTDRLKRTSSRPKPGTIRKLINRFDQIPE